MVSVCTVVAQMWRSFSIDLTELGARARLVQELRLTTESLGEDMGPAVGAVRMADDHLLICRDGGPDYNGLWDDQDVLVEYYLRDGKLIRHDQASNGEIVIAESIASFGVEDVTPALLQIAIEARRSGLSRQVTLRWNR